MLSGRGLCDELITRPEESYRLCCVVVCDLETSRMGAPYIYIYIYIYDISTLRVKGISENQDTGSHIRRRSHCAKLTWQDFHANFDIGYISSTPVPVAARSKA